MADDAGKDRGVGGAIGRIPSGLFILTAGNTERRTGMLASWVQQVAFEPATITVAVRKGRPILALISETRRFGLCQVPEKDKLLLKKFASGVDDDEDPFIGFEMVEAAGAPIIGQSMSYMECEVVTHMDVEADHDLFVGRVVGGAVMSKDKPFVHLRDNGFKY